MQDKSNVKIAILDTGVKLSHPALSNATIHGYAISYDGKNVIISDNFDDNLGHGTAIASIIHSIAPQCEITAIRMFADNLNLEEETLIKVLGYIAENEKFDIINISSGITQPSHLDDLCKICKIISDKGTLILSAFDNEGAVAYPAAFDNVIGVDSGDF